MSSAARTDGHYFPWLADEGVPCEAAVVVGVRVGCEDADGESVIAHELPDVLERVQFWRSRWQWHQGDVARRRQLGKGVSAGLIEQNHGVDARRHSLGHFGQM